MYLERLFLMLAAVCLSNLPSHCEKYIELGVIYSILVIITIFII